jgi:hypothetical protein
MFFGGGFGVGLTVADLTPPEFGPPITSVPALGEVLPGHARTAEEKALELQRVQQLEQSSLPTRSSWWPPSPPTGRPPWTGSPASPGPPPTPGTTPHRTGSVSSSPTSWP